MVEVPKVMTYFATIALAEQAIIDAGYIRDRNRAAWVNATGKIARVMREAPGKFYIQWS